MGFVETSSGTPQLPLMAIDPNVKRYKAHTPGLESASWGIVNCLHSELLKAAIMQSDDCAKYLRIGANIQIMNTKQEIWQ